MYTQWDAEWQLWEHLQHPSTSHLKSGHVLPLGFPSRWDHAEHLDALHILQIALTYKMLYPNFCFLHLESLDAFTNYGRRKLLRWYWISTKHWVKFTTNVRHKVKWCIWILKSLNKWINPAAASKKKVFQRLYSESRDWEWFRKNPDSAFQKTKWWHELTTATDHRRHNDLGSDGAWIK